MQAVKGDKIGRKAFQRQARQILRRLLLPHAYLLLQDNGAYGLYTARSRAKAVMSLKAEFIADMCAHDLLVKKKDRIMASQTGAMWLKRAGAEDKDVFHSQHQTLISKPVFLDGEAAHICKINAAENPLLWLSRRRGADGRKLVNEAQLQAGYCFQNDFFSSTARPRMIADLTAPAIDKNSGRKSGSALRMGEKAVAARARFDKAAAALGPELAEIAIEICCHMRGLEQAERALGWPKRAGKIVLGIALTKLARHYGIIS